MIELLPELAPNLTFETYPAAPEIQGLWLHPLRKNRSDNGWFMEYARIENGQVQNTPAPLELRQISMSHAEAGRINAFHIHTKLPQNEIWTVIQGQLMIWLVDCRKDSSTSGAKRRVILSGEQPTQLFIPAGVAHGYKAASGGATLLYAMDQQFDLSDPNEGRLPWDHFGAELWAEDRG
jgi:dTDP-4-dehydrorhamnose 3,5-epimerase